MNAIGVANHIISWLKDYSENSRTKGYVVGISGGIDSAVTSTLCAKTGLPLMCVEMPIHQAASQDIRAAKHIDWLQGQFSNVSRHRIDLSDTYDLFKSTMPLNEDNRASMPLVNSRARIRMTTLYYMAQLNSMLVCGTGNKVEDFGVGFFTKYGDGGVDVSPIADLMKSEVYSIGSSFGVIEDIMNAAPTDGLWGDDRTDEDQLGASYDELEWAMTYTGSEEGLSERQLKVREIYTRLHKANIHKMIPIPVCTIPEGLK